MIEAKILIFTQYCFISRTCPANPVNFTFDESLVEDTSGSLLANTLAVDNLTIDWLRNKQIELEARLRDNQERQVALCTAAAGAESNGGSSPEVHRSVACQIFISILPSCNQ